MLLSRCVLFLIALPVCHAVYSYSLEQQLRTELFVTNNYNRMARPSAIMITTVQLNILTLKELNIRDQYMSVIGYFVITWDELQRLRWSTNPLYATDISFIFCLENEVWIPPVIIENSVDNIGVLSDSSLQVRVSKAGKVIWAPTNIFTTNCETDVTYYPFDTQTCDIVLTSWGYTKTELIFRQDPALPLGMINYKENGEWEYIGYEVTTSIIARESAEFFQLTYSLTYKRRSTYHVLSSIVPMVVISILACFVFKLPADAGEKNGYALTILLTSAVYLTLLSDNIPTTSLNTPYLSLYLISLLIADIVSVILTVLILDLHHRDSQKPVPDLLQKIVGQGIGRFVCYGNKNWRCETKNENQVVELTEKLSEKKISHRGEEKDAEADEDLSWQDLAKILDIFFFGLYCLFLLLTTMVFLIVMST